MPGANSKGDNMIVFQIVGIIVVAMLALIGLGTVLSAMFDEIDWKS